MPDEITVGGAVAARDPFFSPAVQAIPDAGLLTNLRRHPSGLLDDEVFRFTVARVVLDAAPQGEAALDVLHARLAQRTLRGQGSLARAQEYPDRFLEFVFAQLAGGGDADTRGEVLQLVEIPVAVLELARGHRRREGGGHVADGALRR